MNIIPLLIIVFVYSTTFLLINRSIKNGLKKIVFIFVSLPIFIYSGLGICYLENWIPFLFRFLLYIVLFMAILAKGLAQKKENEKDNKNEVLFIKKYWWIFLVLFYFTYIIFLMIPENHLIYLIKPPLSTTSGIYEKIKESNDNVILDIAQLIRTLLFPVFFLVVGKFVEEKKIIKSLLILGFWFYLSFVSIGYIGRTDILVFVIFIVFIIFSYRNNLKKFKLSRLIIPIIIFAALIPFFLSYQYLRTGRTIDVNFSTIKELLRFELSFPEYYPRILDFDTKFPTMNYILFFILLPIPSVILRTKGSIIISTNVFFTETITGIKYGAQGYSGLLPTIFGESLLVFGPHYFWIHAIIVPLIFVIFINFIYKNKNLRIFYLYIVVYSFTLARGGSEGFFGVLINYTIGYLAFKLIVYLLQPKRRVC